MAEVEEIVDSNSLQQTSQWNSKAGVYIVGLFQFVWEASAKVVQLKYTSGKCGKEGNIARKCLSDQRNMHAMDSEQDVYTSEPEVGQKLFTVDDHTINSMSGKKVKKFFAELKLSAVRDKF